MTTLPIRPQSCQVDYWDRAAKEKVFTHSLAEDAMLRRIDRRARVLDYGCGYGRTCDELFRLGYGDVTGADTSLQMILRGRRLFPHLNLCHVELDSGRIPFADATYDAVLLFAVLTCIPDDTDQKGLVEELFRILRPEGILYLSDYWLQKDDRNRARYQEFFPRFGTYGVFALSEGAVVRHHERMYMEKLLHRFQILDLFDIDVVTMNGNRSVGFQCFCQKKDE